jgi:serine protease
VPGVNLLERLDGCPRPQDTDGHGTLVAGVAVGVANNRVGLAGVAFDAKLMPIRAVSADPVFGLAEGPMDEGVRYAADHGAAVIVLAVTFPFPTDSPTGSDDDPIPAAVAYAWQKGSVVVAPAVNGDLPACGYPAVVERVVCVAATDHMGLPAKYSNLPVKPDLLGFRAPGGFGANRGVIPLTPPVLPMCEDDRDVWTTFLPRETDCGVRGYGTDGGTTEAAAHVAGVAAVLSGMGLSNVEIVECLKTTSFNPLAPDSRGNYDPVYGWGIVDADRATFHCV